MERIVSWGKWWLLGMGMVLVIIIFLNKLLERWLMVGFEKIVWVV